MKAFAAALVFILPVVVYPQDLLPYKNPGFPVERRVQDLLGRMTPQEKFWQLFMIPGDLQNKNDYRHGIFGFQVSAATSQEGTAAQLLQYNTRENAATLATKINTIQKHFVENTRLGIPIIAFDEALHGLVRQGATAFPQAIALAATWDTTLMQQVANAIAYESRQRGIRQILSPVVNLASDVRWGRTEETYGEDPYLCAAMGVAYVGALERAKIISTPKHFVTNVGDGGRDSYPIHFNERYLRETHLIPFKACFQTGGSRSVMTAYNSIDGSPATASNWLLQKLLKEEWQFNGFVISDAGAVGGANVLHFTAKDYPGATTRAIQSGLDVIFQTAYDHYQLFIPPFLDSTISSARIDDAVSRVLRAKFELGLFEDPYTPPALAQDSLQTNRHKALALEAAKASIVLLKNENSLLPLSKNIRSIAVIGADAQEGRLGGYSGPGNGVVSILDGIRERARQDNIMVRYSPGCGRMATAYAVIDEKYLSHNNGTGLLAEYFNSIHLHGSPVLSRTDKQVDFHWTLYGPAAGISDHYSVRWKGSLRSPVTGRYKIGLEGNDGYRLYINKRLVIDNWRKQSFRTTTTDFYFEKNRSYDITIEFYETTGNAHIKLLWNVGVKNDWQAAISKAVDAAKRADVAIVSVGIEEGEFRDRAMLSLPGHQEQLLLQIAATGKPMIVLLTGGSAITMQNWIDKAGAIVDLWYPGEEGGHAAAAVLFGDYNPAGRLPVTFPVHEAQLPLTYHHKPTGRGDDYNNLSGYPLFPFGHGLSYTQFSYSNIRVRHQQVSDRDTAFVYCTIQNTGNREGDEVVQLYIRDQLASVARPVMELKGFRRIRLRSGEAREIMFALPPETFKLYNEKMEWVTEPGDIKIMIGSSSREIRLQTILQLATSY